MAEEEAVEKKKTKQTKKENKTKKKKVKKKKKVPKEEPPTPTEPSHGDLIHLNFDIVSCRNLLKGDIRSSDPYVKILLGTNELHKTKHLLKTLNPVFCGDSKGEFSAKINYGELKKAGGLNIEVIDWDRIGKDDLIGLANIEPSQLLDFAKSGEPNSIQLQVPPGRKETEAGFIDLAIQNAESGDDFGSESKDPSEAFTKDPALMSRQFTRDPVEVSEATAEPSPNDMIHVSFKIVSCRDLLKGDYRSSDPYVKILLGKIALHRTKKLLKTLNPVFGANHDNEFTIEFAYHKLKKAGGVGIEVLDWDAVGCNDTIGLANIAPSRVLAMAESGKPDSIRLQVPRGRKEKTAGYIILTIKNVVEESDDDW